MVSRWTETSARDAAARDAWMQRRIRYFGKACLTTQEYRAVVYSLHGLPQLTRDRNTGLVEGEIEKPTLAYVASKMRISPGRVSQLLSKAADALKWFEEQGYPGIGWERQRKEWHFVAPVGDSPVKREQRAAVRIVPDRTRKHYRLAFAGDL